MLVVWAASSPASGQPAELTFTRDIAPIIFSRCAACHREGGDAPFSLITFDQVQRRARTILAVTRSRYMPPWKPAPESGPFAGTRRLTDSELRRIEQWVNGGMPRGDDHDLPALPASPPGWTLGAPDLVIQLPDYTLRADGPDVFRNFVVTVPLAGQRYVRGWQFRAGTPAVHHANIRIDATEASRRLDVGDPAPGYEGLILRSADFPEGHFLGWTPGQTLIRDDPDAAWPLAPGNDLVVQLHMRPTGKPENIAPQIGLYFSDTPATHLPVMLRLGRQRLSIHAGESRHVVSDEFVLPVPVTVHSVLAHAHSRAKALLAWASLPDGTRRDLLRIDDWDPAWQERYPYLSPMALPPGTAVHLQYTFDNSTGNARNPELPPREAEWGWRTIDEMGDLWLQLTTRDEDRDRLAVAARQKMQAEDAIGCEILISREPRRTDLRNDAGAVYMALDRPADALTHFAEVTRLQPGLPQGWYNAGIAHEALGETSAAARNYATAVKLDPRYSAALNNLASLWIRSGRAAEARPLLDRAVDADPNNVEARANLALLLIAGHETASAIAHVTAAIAGRPERAGLLTQFVLLLAATPDEAARRPADAVRLGESITSATRRRDAHALDALAIAYAASGRFEEAVSTATEALALAPGPTVTEGIRSRLALYRQKRAFVLPR